MLQCITSSCHKLLPDPPITVTRCLSTIDLAFVPQLTLPLYHIQLMLYLVPPFHLCQHLTTWEYLSLIKYRHPPTNNHFLKKGSLVLLTQESKWDAPSDWPETHNWWDWCWHQLEELAECLPQCCQCLVSHLTWKVVQFRNNYKTALWRTCFCSIQDCFFHQMKVFFV